MPKVRPLARDPLNGHDRTSASLNNYLRIVSAQYLLKTCCYETIMFGRVTHTLDATAMQVRSLFYLIHIL